uniref:NADH-ubiquinone oxidoreductase chain 6 n=1 Tax=Noteridae sp. MJTNT-2012 TaxID=1227477 RepID=S4SV94_9COLE|nr:NADH dehydrogenase subunit 6 [Noteridae sp. MJTNT-2012]
MIMITLMMMSMMFLSMNHPMSMGMILVIQTILISMIIGKSSMSFWFSYILFITMIGGLLILFIYMTSIAPNEKFKFSPTTMMTSMIIMTLLIMTIYWMNPLNLTISPDNINSINMEYTIELSNEYSQPLNKMYNMNSNKMTIMLLIYLFITMVACVKITEFGQGPIRQKF